MIETIIWITGFELLTPLVGRSDQSGNVRQNGAYPGPESEQCSHLTEIIPSGVAGSTRSRSLPFRSRAATRNPAAAEECRRKHKGDRCPEHPKSRAAPARRLWSSLSR